MFISVLLTLPLYSRDYKNPILNHIDQSTQRAFFSYEYVDILGQERKVSSWCSATWVSQSELLTVAHFLTEIPEGAIIYTFIPSEKKNRTKKIALTVKKHDIFNDLLLLEGERQESINPIPIATEYPEYGAKVFWRGYNQLGLPWIRVDFLMFDETGATFHPAFFGDSGGIVFDVDGYLIGIITEMATIKGRNFTYTCIGKSVPLEIIQEFLSE